MSRVEKREPKGRKGPGRPTTYSVGLVERICERLAEGEPLTRICRDRGMPAYRTVLSWRVANEEFSHMYARAREDAADTLADRIRDLAERVEKGALDPNAGRVAIDALKWTASKLKPREYGERRHVDVAGRLDLATGIREHCPAWLEEMVERSLPELAVAASAVSPDGTNCPEGEN